MAKKIVTLVRKPIKKTTEKPVKKTNKDIQSELDNKYIGKKVKPKFKGYWETAKNQSEEIGLLIDGVKYANLGTKCEKVLMFHFKGNTPKNWDIAKHFNLCK